MANSGNDLPIHIFISHRRTDENIAQSLIELWRFAIVGQLRVRCTSVEGYGLPGGVLFNEQLRDEILKSRTYVAIMTRESLKSEYMLLELGVRWGSKQKLTLLLAGGLSPNELNPPFREIQTLSCNKEQDIQRLIEEISADLGLLLESRRGAYAKYIKRLQELSLRRVQKPQDSPPASKFPSTRKANLDVSIRLRIREALFKNNRKPGWKLVKTLADFTRVSEDEALRLLHTMPDVVLGVDPTGHRIVRPKSFGF